MRINPGLHVLALSASARQFGLGPEALVLRGLQENDLAFLAALREGLHDGREAAEGSRHNVPAQRVRALTQALSPVLLPWPDAAAPGQAAVPALRMERLSTDSARLSAAYRVNGSSLLRRRSRTAVEVNGLGRIGALLALTLAGAGVGTLVLSDPGVVLPSDIGPGYPLTDQGMHRAQAVKRHVYRLDPTVQVLIGAPGTARAHLDLRVWVGAPPIAGRSTGTPAGEHPHLPVTVQETGVDVGPLVVPGLTPCLECLDRLLADGDSTWYSAADALARKAVDAAPSGVDTSGAVVAAGVAAGQALSFLDGVVQPTSWSAVVSLRAADGYIGQKTLAFHPDCGCRLQQQHSPAQAS
ncbi:ThiF family adenylyltransferase [Arthrobacter citreus]|uniref:ThiF family adenylyltransferase n=1 Tax=Arthrobacter TaxID=1663 RepID=UPI001479093F|nr:ThiF family adenylyltransferase [Arthrobacter gandavensis]